MRHAILSLLAGGLLACTTTSRSEKSEARAIAAMSFAAPTQLTATLVDPIDIDLEWKDNATGESGYFVEGYFSIGQTPPTHQELAIIDVLPPDTTSFRHPKLLPETTFAYRVRPFFGRPSNVAEITTGKAGPQQILGATTSKLASPSVAVVKRALRNTLSEAEAAPTDLQATLIPPAGVKLEWVDHATDEDEYLVEIKPGWGSEFEPSVFLARDATSLVSYDFPPESRFAFRVRAFYYGQPSSMARATTGKDPTLGEGSFIQTQPQGDPTPARSKPQPSRAGHDGRPSS